MQLAAIPVTILISVICGLLTGLSSSFSAILNFISGAFLYLENKPHVYCVAYALLK